MAKHVGDTTGVVIAPSDVAGAVDIAFDETECFVCFRSDCGYVFIPA